MPAAAAVCGKRQRRPETVTGNVIANVADRLARYILSGQENNK
jgi:hypothetical protein